MKGKISYTTITTTRKERKNESAHREMVSKQNKTTTKNGQPF